LKTNLQLRLLRDLLGKTSPADGVFMAFVPGKTYPDALAAVDPAGLAWLASGLGSETTSLLTVETDAALWYSSASRASLEGNGAAEPRLAHAEHYAIETQILGNASIRGTTTVRFQAVLP